MNDLRTAARQALEALKCLVETYEMQNTIRADINDAEDAITALKAALEQPEQRREWRGLTDEEREAAIRWAIELENTQFSHTVARAIEAKLKEKNV